MPPQSKIDRAKAFLKRHETFLACSATAIAAGAVTRYVTTQQILVTDLTISLVNLRDEYAALAQENAALFEFLDNKKLRDEYFEFIKAQANT